MPVPLLPCLQFEQLRSDFEYNLGLLSARDDELHQYEQDIALKTAVLGDRDRQLAELQASYDETYQGKEGLRTHCCINTLPIRPKVTLCSMANHRTGAYWQTCANMCGHCECVHRHMWSIRPLVFV